MLHNVPLPIVNGPTTVQTIVTTNGASNAPLVTVVGPSGVDLPLAGDSLPSPTQSSSTATICEADVHYQEVSNSSFLFCHVRD